MSGLKDTWEEIGRSTTSPTKNTTRKEVKVDDYYVVVGFEVNNMKAFQPATVISGKLIPDVIMAGDVTTLVHDLNIDYGHAFFYIVKNNLVGQVFSFGPKGGGKVGWFGAGDNLTPNKYNRGAFLKDGFKNTRPGIPNYHVNEKINAFKIALSLKQGLSLLKETDKIRAEITSGKQKYTAYMNDTCAEAARDILSSSDIDTPSGSGWVKHTGVVNFPLVYAVNPYMWHHRFKETKKYPSTSGTQFPSAEARNDPSVLIGSADPLF
jgi:hypothetical protein